MTRQIRHRTITLTALAALCLLLPASATATAPRSVASWYASSGRAVSGPTHPAVACTIADPVNGQRTFVDRPRYGPDGSSRPLYVGDGFHDETVECQVPLSGPSSIVAPLKVHVPLGSGAKVELRPVVPGTNAPAIVGCGAGYFGCGTTADGSGPSYSPTDGYLGGSIPSGATELDLTITCGISCPTGLVVGDQGDVLGGVLTGADPPQVALMREEWDGSSPGWRDGSPFPCGGACPGPSDDMTAPIAWTNARNLDVQANLFGQLAGWGVRLDRAFDGSAGNGVSGSEVGADGITSPTGPTVVFGFQGSGFMDTQSLSLSLAGAEGHHVIHVGASSPAIADGLPGGWEHGDSTDTAIQIALDHVAPVVALSAEGTSPSAAGLARSVHFRAVAESSETSPVTGGDAGARCWGPGAAPPYPPPALGDQFGASGDGGYSAQVEPSTLNAAEGVVNVDPGASAGADCWVGVRLKDQAGNTGAFQTLRVSVPPAPPNEDGGNGPSGPGTSSTGPSAHPLRARILLATKPIRVVMTRICKRAAHSKRRACRLVKRTIGSSRPRPVTVAFGRRRGIYGRLLSAAGRPVAGASVRVFERTLLRGARYRLVRTLRTSATGRFVDTVRPGPSRAVRFSFAGTRSAGPTAATIRVFYAGSVSARVSRARDRLVVSGHLRGPLSAHRGIRVSIQAARRGGSFHTIASTRTDRKGRYRVMLRRWPASGARVRAVVWAQSAFAYEQAISPVTREIR